MAYPCSWAITSGHTPALQEGISTRGLLWSVVPGTDSDHESTPTAAIDFGVVHHYSNLDD
jgi:hypothetical protein